ncbi:hypothetical protein BC834DRAFT_35791 [Gloeopeniophorella convolvens]|nr:hypothetical protein BC834DRAFT_35791 [Gloeopeniophorella convolvens]
MIMGDELLRLKMRCEILEVDKRVEAFRSEELRKLLLSDSDQIRDRQQHDVRERRSDPKKVEVEAEDVIEITSDSEDGTVEEVEGTNVHNLIVTELYEMVLKKKITTTEYRTGIAALGKESGTQIMPVPPTTVRGTWPGTTPRGLTPRDDVLQRVKVPVSFRIRML